jgi:hypothetical protein
MVQPGPPPVASDPLTDFFWAGARERRLMIQRCRACGTYIHLPRPVCRACRSFDLAPEQVSGRGAVYTFTETHRPFHPFFVDRVPYLLSSRSSRACGSCPTSWGRTGPAHRTAAPASAWPSRSTSSG